MPLAAAVALALLVPPAIRLESDSSGQAIFRVVGGARSGASFAVYVESGSKDLPPLLGALRTENGDLIFQPRFPLQPGLRYRAVLETRPPVTAVIQLPQTETRPATIVEKIYPSGNRLPENLLKFYIHFSAPMTRGEVYRWIRLLDESEKPVELPFLELGEELWDLEGKRLTVFFDPGRIKRDLTPHREVGTPLVSGKTYTLVIDPEWPNAEGQRLLHAFRKTFSVGPADRQPPQPEKWRLSLPRTGASGALLAELPEPMDHALLTRLVEVAGPDGKIVPGTVTVDSRETRWRFRPREPWRTGNYSLKIGTALEDLAGNKIGRPFEVDVFERVSERIASETVSLPFRISESPAAPEPPNRR